MRRLGDANLVATFSAALVGGALSLAVAAAAPAVGQITPVPNQKLAPPPLKLSDAQRARIREALLTVHTEVSPTSKAGKPVAGFEPAVGAKLPAQLKTHGLPQPLIRRIPALRDYLYVKFKRKIMIVNGMTRKIAAVIAEA